MAEDAVPKAGASGKTRPRTVIPRGTPGLWLVLFVVWVAANGSLEPALLLLGAAIAGVVAYASARATPTWAGLAWTPDGLGHFLAYSLTFLRELVKANIAMLGYIYAPCIRISPGIVKVRTRLKSPMGRLALANTIALTPGSLILGMEGETLYIHWLDVKTTDPDQATAELAAPFERHLEKVFG